MRVALQGSLGLGGIGTVTRELATHLANFVDVSIFDVLGLYQNGSKLQDLKIGNPSGSRIARNLPVNLPFHTLAFSRYDVVHINYAIYGLSALLSKEIFKVPFIETIHGLPQPEIEKGYDRLGYFAERWALPLTLPKASAVVSDSEYLQEELARRFGAKSIVIPLGVNTQHFAPASTLEKKRVRDELAIDGNQDVVLYVGRLHPWKDPLTLVQAASMVLRERKNVVFIFVGKGPLAFTVSETSRILGIAHSVRVVTNADAYQSVVKYYKAADIFVCPTRKEVFGLVLLEAMSSGIPIINGDDGAAIEMTADSGLHFRTGDPHSLADQILNLLDDPALRARLRSRSRERALKLFSWETCAKSYLRLYSAILRKS